MNAIQLANYKNIFMLYAEKCSRVTVSMREYYCYKFHIRNIFNPIFYGGRLFQQFAVDTYIKLESSRLDFIWNNHKQLRADLYQGLLDSIQAGEHRGNAVGKRAVLASHSLEDLKINSVVIWTQWP